MVCSIPSSSIQYVVRDPRFVRVGKGRYTRIWLTSKPEWTEPFTRANGYNKQLSPKIDKQGKVPHVGQWPDIVIKLLRLQQPLTLAEINAVTKIPQADLFKLLSDEKRFERDTNRLYWLVGKPQHDNGQKYAGYEGAYSGRSISMKRWHANTKQSSTQLDQ